MAFEVQDKAVDCQYKRTRNSSDYNIIRFYFVNSNLNKSRHKRNHRPKTFHKRSEKKELLKLQYTIYFGNGSINSVQRDRVSCRKINYGIHVE